LLQVATINRAHGWDIEKDLHGKPFVATVQSPWWFQRSSVALDMSSSVLADAGQPVQTMVPSKPAASSSYTPMSWDYEVETSSLIVNNAALQSLASSLEQTAAIMSLSTSPTCPSTTTSCTDTITEPDWTGCVPDSIDGTQMPPVGTGRVPVAQGSSISSSHGPYAAAVSFTSDNWLDAVLSVPTNRLSSDTDEALIHSLNRLASLR
jgi:hypothetical protein